MTVEQGVKVLVCALSSLAQSSQGSFEQRRQRLDQRLRKPGLPDVRFGRMTGFAGGRGFFVLSCIVILVRDSEPAALPFRTTCFHGRSQAVSRADLVQRNIVQGCWWVSRFVTCP